MNNENMYEEVRGELVDAVNTDICSSTDGFFPTQLTGKQIAIGAGVTAGVIALGAAAVFWFNRDKIRDKKREKELRRMEETARKYGLAIVNAEDCECENED